MECEDGEKDWEKERIGKEDGLNLPYYYYFLILWILLESSGLSNFSWGWDSF